MTTLSFDGIAAPSLRGGQRTALSTALAASTALSGSLARIFGALIPAVAAGALLVSADALAQTAPVAPNTLPTGGTVVGGTATITQSDPNKLQITQSTDKAIIDWRSYSIGSQAWVNYTQPSSTSVSLNRVTGGDVSYIFGKLTANGQVMLINPNGIVFGKGSIVDVAGLVATTANISNDDFMAGRMRFLIPGKADATVVNDGSITIKDAGIAAFVAPGVENRGTIVANLGTVSLAAGNTFTLDLYGDGLVRLAVTDPVTVAALGEGQALVKNSGTIKADGGKVLITAAAAKGVVDTVINMDGVIQARSVTQQADGTIILDGGANGTVNVAGTLDVSAKTPGVDAGKVTVTGEKVRLASTARIDATAVSGKGGTVKIGGDYQGKGDTRQAQIVTIDAGALIDASAIERGDGGLVVVWSTDTTTFNGIILAKGGQYAGNGGLVETSGQTLHVGDTALVNTLAPNGVNGTWLLDPATILIQNAGGDITPTTLETNLTAGNVTLQADTSITFGDDVTYIGTNTLTLDIGTALATGTLIFQNNDSLTIRNLVLQSPKTSGTGITIDVGSGDSGIDFPLAGTSLLTLKTSLGGDNPIITNGPTNVLISPVAGLAMPQIQKGIDFVRSGGTINVESGLYQEHLQIEKSLTLIGNPTTDAVDPAEGATPYPAPQPGASDSGTGLVVIQGPGTGSTPAITITDGGGQGVALNVTIRGFVIDGNTNHAIDAEVGNGIDVVAGSSLKLSRNTIIGASEPSIVLIKRFETVNILYNVFPNAVANVIDINAVGTAHIVRNVILAMQEDNPGNDDVAITVNNLVTALDFRMNIIDGSFFPVDNGQPGLADGLSITAANDATPAVLIKNNFFNGLGRDAIVFASGTFGTEQNPVTIYQNYIGGDGTGANEALRTDLLSGVVIGYHGNPPVADKLTEAGPTVDLIGNNRDGIAIESNADGWFSIKENFLAGNNKGNQGFNLDVDSRTAHVDASFNWWGTANTVVGTSFANALIQTALSPLATGADGNCINSCITQSDNEPFAFQQAQATTQPPTTEPPTTQPPTTQPPTTEPPTTQPPTTEPPTTQPPTTQPPTTEPPTTQPPTTQPPTTEPPTTQPPTTQPPTTQPPGPPQGQGPFELSPVADAFIQFPWVDLNFIDGLRTSFFMLPNGGPYYYATFDSQFALNGQMFGVLRGPLAPQQGAAPPVPATTPLGELAPAAGPGSTPPPGQQPPDPCAVNFMTNFWTWYSQCSPGAGGPPQQ